MTELIDPPLVIDLKTLKWRPGTIDLYLDLYRDLKTDSVRIQLVKDMETEIREWIPRFEKMAKDLKNDPIAAPTKDEKAFYKWAITRYRST